MIFSPCANHGTALIPGTLREERTISERGVSCFRLEMLGSAEDLLERPRHRNAREVNVGSMVCFAESKVTGENLTKNVCVWSL